jgi:hypothetical protein
MMIIVAFLAALFASQAPVSPEVAKLGAFLGDWKLTSEPIAGGSPERVRVDIHCGWSAMGEYLVCSQKPEGAPHAPEILCIYRYDTERKGYVFTNFTPTGDPAEMLLAIDSNTWNYTTEQEVNGKKQHVRTIDVFTSPNEVMYTYARSDNGTDWTTLGRGKIMKQP